MYTYACSWHAHTCSWHAHARSCMLMARSSVLMHAHSTLIHMHSHSQHTQRNVTNVVIVFRSTLKYLLLFVHPKFHSSMKLHSMYHVNYGVYFRENKNNVYNSYQWISTQKNCSSTIMILLKSSSVFSFWHSTLHIQWRSKEMRPPVEPTPLRFGD